MTEIKKIKELEDFMYKNSPLFHGLTVKDENKGIEDYNKITNHVYLGNIKAAKNKNFFKDKKIKAVINCSNDIPNFFESKDIEYLRIPIEDDLKEKDSKKLYEMFPLIVEFISKHADLMKENVFCHCQKGFERSASSIVAYLMAKKGMNVKKACMFTMSKRPEVFFYGQSVNFSKPLVKYDLELKKNKTKRKY